jgi:DNA polymerase-1
MKPVPLYPSLPLAVVEQERPRNATPLCNACPLYKGATSVCLKAEGDPGGLLVVGEYPGRAEDERGRPFVGESGRYLRRLLARQWHGPYALDNSIRCAPGAATVTETCVQNCRGFLAQTVREAEPTRVLAMGTHAAMSLLGRSPPLLSVRRGYGWLYNADVTDTGAAIPVFLLPNPAAALRNRFIRQWLERDLAWALEAQPAPPPWDAVAQQVETLDDAKEACALLRAAPWFAWDVETCGLLHEQGFRVLCLSACAKGSRTAYLWDEAALLGPLGAPMRSLLADPSVGKVGQNLKYDAASMRTAAGVVTAHHHGDTRLWRKLLAAHANAKLETLVELVGMGGMKEEAEHELALAVRTVQQVRARAKKAVPLPGLNTALDMAVRWPSEKPQRFAFGLLPKEVLHRYNARDTVGTTLIGEQLEPRVLGDKALGRVWEDIVAGANEAVEQVEAWGIAASRENARIFEAHLDAELLQVDQRLQAYPDLNIDNPASVAKLLYETLGLPPSKMTEHGAFSTDKEALKALMGAHPVVEDVLAHRKLSKLRGTYAIGVPSFIRSDGRIHPDIKLDGAETGRTSCEKPNLQNIPRPGSAVAKMARDMFVAPPGYLLLEADFSQLELRVATMLSQDPEMLRIWAEGVDYHQRTAELIAPVMWGIDASQVTSEHRSTAKTVNFGIIYGRTPAGLAKQLGCSIAEAEEVINAVKGKFRKFAEWCARQHDTARRTGYVHTWWDGQPARRRALPDVASKDDQRRAHAENAAINSPIQGTASDFCIASLVECVRWIKEDCVPAKLVLTVHDSLMFEVEESALEEVAYQVDRIMRSWPSAGVPLVVDMKVGQAWGSLQNYALQDAAA